VQLVNVYQAMGGGWVDIASEIAPQPQGVAAAPPRWLASRSAWSKALRRPIFRFALAATAYLKTLWSSSSGPAANGVYSAVV